MSRWSHEHPDDPRPFERFYGTAVQEQAHRIARKMTAPEPAEPCAECDRSPCTCRERSEDER